MDDDFHRGLVRLAQPLGHCICITLQLPIIPPLNDPTPVQHRELQDSNVKIIFHKSGETPVPHCHRTKPLACFRRSVAALACTTIHSANTE